jgi:uncharacterized protein (TIGR04255 family)
VESAKPEEDLDKLSGPYLCAAVIRAELKFSFADAPDNLIGDSAFSDLARFGYSRKEEPEAKHAPTPLRAESDERAVSPLINYIYVNSDTRHTVKLTNTSFSFSRNAPHGEWETFAAEAKRVWNICESSMKITAVSGLIIEYYYILTIPLSVPLRRFFNVYPSLPDQDALLMSMTLLATTNLAEIPGSSHQVMMLPGKQNSEKMQVSVLLVNQFSFRLTQANTAWDKMDLIRDLKNRTFESQITDEFRALK